jgi:hypothetical protein
MSLCRLSLVMLAILRRSRTRPHSSRSLRTFFCRQSSRWRSTLSHRILSRRLNTGAMHQIWARPLVDCLSTSPHTRMCLPGASHGSMPRRRHSLNLVEVPIRKLQGHRLCLRMEMILSRRTLRISHLGDAAFSQSCALLKENLMKARGRGTRPC